MKSLVHPDSVLDLNAEVGTILSYRSLLKADDFCNALLKDISTVKLGDAFRELGLSQVSFWIQRSPDAAVVMWEGTDIETLFDRYAASPNPTLVRWRGQLRVYSGPDEADGFWDASHHRLLSWSTGEQGAQSEIRIDRQPEQVEAYRRLAEDFQGDPSLMSLIDRVRRRQGFTRIETWHQESDGGHTLLSLVEANDLNDSMAQIATESNDLDKRTMKVVRATFHLGLPPPSTLLARWHAQD